MFLFGTMRKNWDLLLIQDKKNMSEPGTDNRLLSEDSKPIDNPISLDQVGKELKYWVYFISWALKLYTMFLVAKMKRT
jgi:hypothetical protein